MDELIDQDLLDLRKLRQALEKDCTEPGPWLDLAERYKDIKAMANYGNCINKAKYYAKLHALRNPVTVDGVVAGLRR